MSKPTTGEMLAIMDKVATLEANWRVTHSWAGNPFTEAEQAAWREVRLAMSHAEDYARLVEAAREVTESSLVWPYEKVHRLAAALKPFEEGKGEKG